MVSNPYRAATSSEANVEATMGWTRTKFDKGGRVIEVRSYTGSGLPAPFGANATSTGAVTTAYDANFTTVTDQAGKVRRSMKDGLGRLVRVDEPNALNSLGTTSAPVQPTDYTYDALGNLTQVDQGVQTRTFVYDSLSRLASATNPESGTYTYQYDANGNLTKKIEPRFIPNSSVTEITTTLTYDALNRPTTKLYNDATPDIYYYYDAQTLPAGAPTFTRGYSVGRLVAITYGAATASAGTYYGHDALGRTLRRIQQTDSVNYQSDATYNKTGAKVTETYPAVPGATTRRAVTYAYDTAGRLSSLAAATTAYSAYGASVTGINYAAHGGVSAETLGSAASLGNDLVHTLVYNSRLQPTQIRLGTGGSPTSVLYLTYNYGATVNNGNVLDVTERIGTWTRKQIYTYDSLNRLESTSETNGSTTTPLWTEDEAYDRYGNRWEVVGGLPSLSFDPATNRITTAGYSYDAAGNVTDDIAHTYAYDAANRIKTVDAVANAYRYDGEGKRIKKYFPSGDQLRFVYGLGGQLLMEFDANDGTLKKEYVYGASGLLATIDPADGTRYTVADHLGSPRVVVDTAGGVVSRHDYRPFGRELVGGDAGRTEAQGFGAQDGVRQQFTGKERDNETALDYFSARYYSSTQGRFTGVDPGPFVAADPQSWNRYACVQNNPLKFVDLDGRTLILKGKDADYLVSELDKITGYKLNRDKKTGKVSIDTGVKRKTEGTSDPLAEKLSEIVVDPNTTVKIKTVNNKDSVRFDSFMDKKLDVADYKVFKQGGIEFAAAAPGHVLAEYYEAERNYSCDTPREDRFDWSHTAELLFESRVLSGHTGQTEKERSEIISRQSKTVSFVYTSVQYDVEQKSVTSKKGAGTFVSVTKKQLKP